MSTDRYEKLMKLLRLAQRGTGAEADLALVRAQKLAVELQVDIATMDVTEGEAVKKEEFTEGKLEEAMKGREYTKGRLICRLLQEHFRVKTCWWTHSGTVQFVGRKSDVFFATYLFSWLQERFTTEWKKELKKPNTDGRRRTANSFYYGMYLGMDASLTKAKRDAEDDRIGQIAARESQSSDPGLSEALRPATEAGIRKQYQLAVVNEEDELAKEYHRLHPSVTSSSLRISSKSATEAGRAAGARTRLPGLPLNSSSRSSLK